LVLAGKETSVTYTFEAKKEFPWPQVSLQKDPHFFNRLPVVLLFLLLVSNSQPKGDGAVVKRSISGIF